MRRVWLVATVAVAVGCSGARDLFSVHADVAAEAAGQQLTAERLAQLMSQAKKAAPNAETARYLADFWVDYTLFTQAVGSGISLTDSATAAAVLWPQISELSGTHWHDTLVARRYPFTDATLDSIYDRDSIRVLQHILFRAATTADAKAKSTARQHAEAALKKLRGGANFGALATQLTEDPSGKDQEGFLTPSAHGAFVKEFDSAGWALPPGGLSGITTTSFGYHIIRRPPKDEARDHLRNWLETRTSAALDSVYLDSLALTNHLEVLSGTPHAVRIAMADRDQARHSTKDLARFTGGSLTVADLTRWVDALGTQYATQLLQGDDSLIQRFTKIVAQNTLLLRDAENAGIRITPEEWASSLTEYQASLDTITTWLHVRPQDLPDSAGVARSRLIADRLQAMLDTVTAGKGAPRPLPGLLSALLRQRGQFHVYPAGLERAVALMEDLRAEKRAQPPPRGPAFTPAPGPPPVAPTKPQGAKPGAP